MMPLGERFRHRVARPGEQGCVVRCLVRYFLDTEFDDERPWPELISVGIVSEDGREYYAELAEFDRATAKPWVAEHVVPHLAPALEAKPAHTVRDDIAEFFLPGAKEVWAGCPAYDWTLVHRLFGTWDRVPAHIPWNCWDLGQWHWQLGEPDVPLQGEVHHALIHAREALAMYRGLERRAQQ